MSQPRRFPKLLAAAPAVALALAVATPGLSEEPPDASAAASTPNATQEAEGAAESLSPVAEVTTRNPAAAKAKARQQKKKQDAGDAAKPKAKPGDSDGPEQAESTKKNSAAAARLSRLGQAAGGDDGPGASENQTAAQNSARLAALKNSNDGGGDSGGLAAPAAPNRPRLRKTFETVEAAAEDSSDAYKAVYKRLAARKDFSVEMVDDDDGTGGGYDAAAKKIRLRKKELNGNEVVDTLLFESFNADNKRKFDANAKRLLQNKASLKEFGDEQADIELDTVVNYVKAIRKMVQDDPNAELQLTDRAKAARKLVKEHMSDAALDDYPDLKDAGSTEQLKKLKQVSRDAPHDPNGSGRFRLPTAELYRFEKVDNMKPGGVMSLLNAAIGKVSQVEKNALRVKVVKNDKELGGAAGYVKSVNDAQSQFKNKDFSKQKLSPAAEQVANEEQRKRASGGV